MRFFGLTVHLLFIECACCLWSVPDSFLNNQGMSSTYRINTTWDGRPVNHDPVTITVGPVDANVAEAFFLNDRNQYLEVELSPHGLHLLLLLKGQRDSFKDQLPIQYTSNVINGGATWVGVAHVPAHYFPPKVTKFNAYAIHGSGAGRTYEALYPVPTGKYTDPDFHKLDYFQHMDFRHLLPDNWSPHYTSPEWDPIIAVG
ncbi:UPF0462 protein C4orf33 homolog isoform X3 [Dreissena polymorpha]|uniref:UPF0462 protein C4orf33 homolog isoform X3 n=1 Tax=Dreissena polymorpha TaxID=45954 RepID=UPI0022645476|nr:UPF0462 protein C4orf33 homolog isoform X3 [Dreissena polymorpha]